MKQIVIFVILVLAYVTVDVIIDKGIDAVFGLFSSSETEEAVAEEDPADEETLNFLAEAMRYPELFKKVMRENSDETLIALVGAEDTIDWSTSTDDDKIAFINGKKICPVALGEKAPELISQGKFSSDQAAVLEMVSLVCIKPQIAAYKLGIEDKSEAVQQEAKALGKVIEQDSEHILQSMRVWLFDPVVGDPADVNVNTWCIANENIKRCRVEDAPYNEIVVVLKDPKGKDEFLKFSDDLLKSDLTRFHKVHFVTKNADGSEKRDTMELKENMKLKDTDFLSVNWD